jgi:Fe-S oxidoreductase
MNLLLLAPYAEDLPKISTTLYPPMGILYLAACVEDIVDQILVIDANVLELTLEQTYNKIIDFSPDVVGLSINMTTSEVSKVIAQKIKNVNSTIKLIAGGPSPTSSPAEWLEYFDIVIVGEGEIPFRNIIEQLLKSSNIDCSCPGICIKGGAVTKADHPDLENLPFPGYKFLYPHLHHYSKKARIIKPFMAPILTSRGCPYSCTFCDKSVHGTGFRPRSPESVLNEIRWLRQEWGIKQIDILDDNFTFDLNRAEIILNGIIEMRKTYINCQNGLRADRLTYDLIKKMKAAGVFRVGIGIESGNKEVLSKLNKKLDLDTVEKSIRLFKKERITVHGFFIIGLPFESISDIEDTIEYAIKVDPHFANFSRYFPIEGTPIYNELTEKNKLNENGERSFFSLNPSIEYDIMSNDEVSDAFSRAWKKFYFRPYKMFDIIRSIRSFRELIWIVRLGLSVLKRF